MLTKNNVTNKLDAYKEMLDEVYSQGMSLSCEFEDLDIAQGTDERPFVMPNTEDLLNVALLNLSAAITRVGESALHSRIESKHIGENNG